MKTYLRIVSRRVEAAFRIAVRPTRLPPVEEVASFAGVPPEIIDLASAPYAARFPELAARRRG